MKTKVVRVSVESMKKLRDIVQANPDLGIQALDALDDVALINVAIEYLTRAFNGLPLVKYSQKTEVKRAAEYPREAVPVPEKMKPTPEMLKVIKKVQADARAQDQLEEEDRREVELQQAASGSITDEGVDKRIEAVERLHREADQQLAGNRAYVETLKREMGIKDEEPEVPEDDYEEKLEVSNDDEPEEWKSLSSRERMRLRVKTAMDKRMKNDSQR